MSYGCVRTRSNVAFLAMVLLSLATLSSAQMPADADQNLPPFGGFTGSDFDIVSLQNGNLHLSIPLIEVAERGGKGNWYKYVYDTQSYAFTFFPPTPPPKSKPGYFTVVPDFFYTGFRIASPFTWNSWTSTSTMTCFAGTGSQHQSTITYYGIQDEEGVKHQTGVGTNPDTDPCLAQNVPAAPTFDGSGLFYDLTPGAPRYTILKDGSRISEDTNGNILSPSNTAPCNTVSCPDTLNRIVVVPTNGSTVTFTTPLGKTLHGPQYMLLSYTDSNGAQQTFRIDYQALDINNGICTPSSQCINPQGPKLVPSKLTLPNGAFYQFTWVNNSQGQIQQIQLPTGASISYTYNPACTYSGIIGNSGQECRMWVTSRTVTVGSSTATWTYTHGTWTNGPQTTVTDPYGNDEVHQFTYLTAGSGTSVETQVNYYSGSSATGKLLKTVSTTYAYTTIGLTTINLRPSQQTITLDNGQSSMTQTDYETFQAQMCLPGSNGCGTQTVTRRNPIAVREYDNGSLIRTTNYTYLHQSSQAYVNLNIVDRVATKTVLDGGGNQIAKTVYEYDNYSHPNQPMASSGAVQHDSNFGTNYTTRGNITAVELWRNTDGAMLTTTKQYDDAGNVLSSIDPLGNKTAFDFTDSWSNSTCAPSGQGKAYLTKITNALNQVTTNTYDSCTARAASHTDANQQTTSYLYDLLDRTVSVRPPAPEGMISFTYTDTPGSLSVQKQRVISGSSSTNEYDLYDGLGREVSHVIANGQATPYDKTDTCYDLRDLKSFVSYPYQTSTWNSWPACPISQSGDSYAYDALERTTSVTHSDSTAITSSYTGRATNVTDEGNGTRGVQKISQVDALGRLVSACEVTATALSVGTDNAPAACGQNISATGFLTTYSYDALGNLTSVVQGSSLNQRTFTYDSLSHLITAANPESGTTCYGTWNSSSRCIGGYDSDGNVISRTRPAPNQSSSSTYVTTTYAYDALNRLHTKTYSDGTTPSVSLNYDETSVHGNTLTNTIGRLSSEYTGSSSAMTSRSILSYDARGWIVEDIQCTPQNCPKNSYFTFNYGYDGVGDVTSSSNGNGVNYTLTYSTAPRLTTLNSSWLQSGSQTGGNLISNLLYNSFGEPLSSSLYNGINENWGYDTRGRLQSHAAGTKYSLSNLTYSGNGNVLSATDTVNGTWSSYSYDDFNRLISSSCAAACPGTGNQNGLAFSYVYDRYGNRWQQNVTKGTGGQAQFAFDANNHVTASGYTFDAAGNIINDSTHTYTYDAENRIVKVDSAGTGVYAYDAEGRRVAKTAGASQFEYLFDLGGRALTELVAGTATTNRSEGYAGGRHLVTQNLGTTYFIHSDWLGTERARTGLTGSSVETCTSLAYGDSLTCTGTDVSPLHFTGKERDSESGLDEFGARYYASSLGRFMIPDWAAKPTSVPYANFGNPQSLNLYSYVENNPTTVGDPDGHCVEDLCIGEAAITVMAISYLASPPGQQMLGRAATDLWNAPQSLGHWIGSQIHKESSNSSSTTEQGRDAGGKFLPKQPGQTQPGAESEKETLAAEGATKTGTALPGTNKRVDGTVTATGQKIEVKAGQSVNNTEQLKATGQASQAATGQPLLVTTTNPNVHVSAPAQQNQNLEIRPAKKPEQQ